MCDGRCVVDRHTSEEEEGKTRICLNRGVDLNTVTTQIYVVHAVQSQIHAHISVVHILYLCALALCIVNTSWCRATILAVIQMHK